jgi:hypothetical protein
LFDDGFDIVPQSDFENRIVYITSEIFNIVIVMDRGDIDFQISPIWYSNWITTTKHAISLVYLIGFLTNDIKYKCYKRNIRDADKQLETIARELKKHFLSLTSLFEQPNFDQSKLNLEMYIKAKQRKELPNIPFDESWHI